MIASITDAATLHAIGPNEVAAYLRSRGWRQVEQIGDRAAVWTAEAHENGDYEILLPLDAGLSDYARRISEVLQTLEVAEQRSQLDIARDIAATTSDVLRVRLVHGAIEAGTLPLEQGVTLLQGARDLILAAACAAARPRAFYSSRRPSEALAYINGLRMGQTEQGSFVLSLLSPVTPRAQTSLFAPERSVAAEEPFERRVFLTLTLGLTAVQRAAVTAAALEDYQPFLDAIASGVSANLCDALVKMSMDNTAEEIALQIRWSPLRRATDKTPTQFRFRRDIFPFLREASRLLRESAPAEDIALVGMVTALRRENTPTGQITVSVWLKQAVRQVVANLSEADYSKAVQAHDTQDFVYCEGKLTKESRRYVLHDVHNFAIVDFSDGDLSGVGLSDVNLLNDSDSFADE